MSRFIGRLFHLLHEHLDLAAAGEADVPGLLVGDAEIEQLRLAAGDGLLRLLDHRTLDAAAGDRADEFAAVIDRELAADGAGAPAPGGGHRGERPRLSRIS